MLSKKFLLTYSIYFLSSAGLILANSLSNSLLLSTYDKSIFGYFFIILSLATIGLSVLLKLIGKRFKANMPTFTKIGFTLVLVAIYLLSLLKVPFSILTLSALLIAFSLLSQALMVNMVMQYFDILEAKKANNYFILSGTIGVIAISSILSSVELSKNAMVYLYGLIDLLVIFNMLAIKFLLPRNSKPKPKKNKLLNKSSKQKKHRSAITKGLIILTIFAFAATTFIDYGLKLAMSDELKSNEVGAYISNLFLIIGIINTFVQLIFINPIINVVGTAKLIVITPAVLLLSSLGSIFFTGLTRFSFLFIVSSILFYTIRNLATALYINTLDNNESSDTRLVLKGQIKPIATILSSVAILLISVNYAQTISMTIIIFSAMLMTVVAIRLVPLYSKQLTKMVYLKRFTSDFDIRNNEAINESINIALKSTSDDVIFYGLKLLRKLDNPFVPRNYKELLLSKNENIVYSTINLGAKFKDKSKILSLLLESLDKHSDVKILFEIADLILKCKADFNKIKATADNLINSDNIDKKAVGHLLYCIGNSKEKNEISHQFFSSHMPKKDYNSQLYCI